MRIRELTKRQRRGFAILLSGLLLQSVATPARAFDDVIAEKIHFFECLGYMLSGDEAAHKANCQPNRPPIIFEDDDDDPVPAVVVVPEPEPEPSPVVDCESVFDDSCSPQ